MKPLAKPTFSVVGVTPEDARRATDALTSLRSLVLACEGEYPGIGRWFREKVVPGLKSGERAALIGLRGGVPVVSAVLKHGPQTKFCHLRIRQDEQDSGLGDLFFALLALEARRRATRVHFTLPESLWSGRQRFFESFGFSRVERANRQYRLFDEELRSGATFDAVWRATLSKLPQIARTASIRGLASDSRLLMSIRSEFVDRILAGTKRVEVRRRFSARWAGCGVALYSSGRDKALVGEATVERVVSGAPAGLWDQFSTQLGCSREDYDAYTEAAGEVSLVFLANVRPYLQPVPLGQIGRFVDNLHPPQSYCVIDDESPWAKAVALAGLLHTPRRSLEAAVAG